MRVGIDIRAIGKNRTGDETVTRNLVQNLSKIDTKNKYYLFTDTTETKAIEKLLSLNNPNFKIIPVLPKNKLLWTFWSLPWALKKNPVDVLHVQYITPQILPRKTKLITTIHDISFVRFPRLIDFMDLFLLRTFIPLSLQRADHIVSVSEFTKQEILDHYHTPSNKITTIQNGGASQKFQPTQLQTDEAILKRYNLSRPFLIYIGTLQPRKNIPFLIETFGELIKENQSLDNLTLAIGGNQKGKNYDTRIDQSLSKSQKNRNISKKIKMLGYVSDQDLPVLYRNAKGAVFTSLYEGFGLPIIEAMASGTPVICNRNSSFKEVAGKSAFFYSTNSKQSLKKKLLQLTKNNHLRTKKIQTGLLQSKQFSWEKTARKTLDLYQKLSK